MEDKFIRNRILTIDQEARDRVKNLVNEYAANSKGHPFGSYGDSITLEKYELCPIYVVELHSQFDQRPINTRQYPYKGGSFASRSIYRASDVNAWSYSLLTTEKFVHNGKSFEVTGSHHVETCDPCVMRRKRLDPLFILRRKRLFLLLILRRQRQKTGIVL